MATRLRIEPYNRNAVDADNDGIVQEGTAFERPAGTNIVDEIGNIIQEGVTATQRAANFRVVDRNGNNVDYTPTYGTDATALAAPTVKPRSFFGATLGERYGTLQSTGRGSLGERYGTLGGGRPKDSVPKWRPPTGVAFRQERINNHFDIALGSMDPEMRTRATGARERIKELVGKVSETTGIDRGSLETLAVGGTYWATFLFGGGQLSGLVNDIATGLGDADITSNFSELADFVTLGGMPGLIASFKMSLESLGIDPDEAQQFFQNIGEALRNAGIAFGELSKEMLAALEKIMQEIVDTFFSGPPPVVAFAKSAEELVEVKAAVRLKLEPYNPDAVDADNDGIVQEGTAWERPAATQIVDALGNIIEAGKMAGQRPGNARVVDADGKDVPYTPTYMRPQGAKPDGPPTSGLRTVGQSVRGEPSQKPAKPAPPEEPPFKLPKLWRKPARFQGELPKQEYDTPLLGQPLMRGCEAPTTELIDNSDGRYIPERRELHRKIVNHLLAEARQKQKPREPGQKPKIYFMGGGSGSGKSRFRKDGKGDIPAEVAALDPDKVKEMIPEYRKWVSEGNPEAAALVHEESKHIFELATAQAMQDELDFVYDTTGNGSYSKMKRTIQQMQEKGYEVAASYISISTARALKVNEERYQRTGRKVPSHQVAHSHKQTTENLLRGIADGLFDELTLYDNNTPDDEPFVPIMTLIDGEAWVGDYDRWRRFLEKLGDEGYFGKLPGAGILFDEFQIEPTFYRAAERVSKDLGRDDLQMAVAFYTANGYWEINTTLRDPEWLDDEAYNKAVKRIEALDILFEKASIGMATPTTVHRGTVDTVPIGELGLAEDSDLWEEIEEFVLSGGEVGTREDIIQLYVDRMNADLAEAGRIQWEDEGYGSTSTDAETARSFAEGTTKPSGGVGEGMPSDMSIPSLMEIELPAGARFIPGSDSEDERILPRGTSYRVVRWEVHTTGNGRFYAKAVVTARTPKKPPTPLELVEIDDE